MNAQDTQKVLWDIDAKERVSLPVKFVIQRILSYGGFFLVIKAIRFYGRGTVKDVFLAMKPTSMPLRKYHYFKNFLLL